MEPRNNKGPKDWQTAFALTCTITRFLYIEVLFYIYIFLFLGANNIIRHTKRFVAQRFDVPHQSKRTLDYFRKKYPEYANNWLVSQIEVRAETVNATAHHVECNT